MNTKREEKEETQEVWLKVPSNGWLFGAILGLITGIIFISFLIIQLVGKCD